MKKIKKVVLFFAVIFTIVNVNMSVNADVIYADNIDGSELTQNASSTTTLESHAKGQLLNKGTASVTDNGGGSVNVYGAVIGSVVCDKMILELTLQRYSNGSWINVKSFSNTAYNTSLLTKSYNVKVTKGYYYRVKAACVAQKGGISESKMPVTDGILID